jgi:hypothetical protein
LRDENGLPSERLLQAVWQHQRLRRDQLKTADRKIVRVFHPGFISLEGGPDFCSAIIQIGGDAPRSGDVEIDLRSSGWRAHGHDRNPNFQNVILHVVWESDGTPNSSSATTNRPPTLALHNSLDAPLGELSLSLENEPLRSLPENLRGKCCAPLRELDETQLTGLLREAARIRFQFKAGQFRVRAKNVGWEQTLWENLFRALGYKHNVWPMQNLAETKSRWAHGANSAFEFQARLLGVSGLLPEELTRAKKVPTHICDARGISGGANVMNLRIAFCRARPGNFTVCDRRIIRNGGWHSRRTGLRIKISFQKLKTGARRKSPRTNFWIRCLKFFKPSAMNSGLGIGHSSQHG